MDKVFIQTWPDGVWLSENQFKAFLGFDERGYEVEPFTFKDLLAGKLNLTPETIVVGSVDAVRKAFQILGVALPDNIDIPECLLEFSGRDIWDSTLGEIRKLKDPVFIKPKVQHKAFTGHIVGSFKDLIETAPLGDDFPVLVQEIVKFVSEYRTMVLRGEILGVKHYCGDPLLFPCPDVIRSMVEKYKGSCPVAYSIDVGVTPEGGTLLIEVNDSFALGAYGLCRSKYVDMIEARWMEIVKG